MRSGILLGLGLLVALGLTARADRADGTAAAPVQEKGKSSEDDLDKEYLARVPPFKPTPFAGRKAQSDRAVLMELFTGATCPPCVAADVAFDALLKTYKKSDVVMLQYHLHIPGPDPMTNPDSEARWAYYRKTFAKEMRGVPSTVFDGKPTAGGGGGMAASEKKYGVYCGVIDPLLEGPSGAKVKAAAKRKGDKIDVTVSVSGLTKTGNDVRLRLALVEENIRYVGSNSIRFHHHVVRNMPGGVDGFALKEKDSKHVATVDVGKLRGKLVEYLDDYAANKRKFPQAARPLAMEQLRLIAFVQDDDTREILQATQVGVTGNSK